MKQLEEWKQGQHQQQYYIDEEEEEEWNKKHREADIHSERSVSDEEYTPTFVHTSTYVLMQCNWELAVALVRTGKGKKTNGRTRCNFQSIEKMVVGVS